MHMAEENKVWTFWKSYQGEINGYIWNITQFQS